MTYLSLLLERNTIRCYSFFQARNRDGFRLSSRLCTFIHRPGPTPAGANSSVRSLRRSTMDLMMDNARDFCFLFFEFLVVPSSDEEGLRFK